MWEGSQRVDLIETFAPWAAGRCAVRCAVDAVACCLVPRGSGGRADLVQVSDAHPLSECKHYIASIGIGDGMEAGGNSIESYYHSIGQMVLGTVTNGDCGPDVMCQMVGREQSAASRDTLRGEIADYLQARIKAPWMQDLMANLQEISMDDLKRYRSSGAGGVEAFADDGEDGGVEVVGDSAEGAGPSGGSGAAAAAGDNGAQGEEARALKEKTLRRPREDTRINRPCLDRKPNSQLASSCGGGTCSPRRG